MNTSAGIARDALVAPAALLTAAGFEVACVDDGQPIPHLSEPWYCCAEPTDQQLQAF